VLVLNHSSEGEYPKQPRMGRGEISRGSALPSAYPRLRPPTKRSEAAPAAPKEPPVYQPNGNGANGPNELRDRVQVGPRLQRFDDTDRWPVFAAPFNSQAVDLGFY